MIDVGPGLLLNVAQGVVVFALIVCWLVCVVWCCVLFDRVSYVSIVVCCLFHVVCRRIRVFGCLLLVSVCCLFYLLRIACQHLLLISVCLLLWFVIYGCVLFVVCCRVLSLFVRSLLFVVCCCLLLGVDRCLLC